MQVVYGDGCFDLSSLVGPQKSTSGEPEKVDLCVIGSIIEILQYQNTCARWVTGRLITD